jgi:serine/threonine protein kinase
MQPGAFLQDHQRAQARFRIKELLASGKNYQIALAEDTHLEGKLVCVKAIEYEVAHITDTAYVRGRREALRGELEFLTLPIPLLPEPLDWIELVDSPTGQGPEPTLVYEFQHGETLYDLVRTKHPQGLAHARALRLFAELVRFAGEVHEHGYIFRDFDPRHIIVGFDDILHVVGCGNAAKRGDRLNVYKMNTNPAYTAPEIRRELSGKMLRPACDFYSLGCLLAFMLTGVETAGERLESPLEIEGYDKLRSDAMPEGLRLLVTRCLQPLSQKRFQRASDLLAYCAMDRLPTATTEGFGLLNLPAPWSGPEGMDNRALRSRLSPGPLISVREGPATPPGPPPTDGAMVPQQPPGELKRQEPQGCLGYILRVLGLAKGQP